MTMQRSRLAAIAALTIAVLSGSAINASTPACPLNEAMEWASSPESVLPTSLADLRRLTDAYQRAAFAYLPAEAKASLWNERIAEVLASPSVTLETSQREFLLEIQASVDDIVAGRVARMDSVSARAIAILGKDRARLLIGSFEDISNTVGGRLLPPPYCNCNGSSDFCGGSTGPTEKCKVGFQDCLDSNLGCGILWVQECNGVCQPACDTCTTLPGGGTLF